MKVLLKEGAAEASAATILYIPQVPETVFETLSGEGVREGGAIAEADYSTVATAINSAGVRRGIEPKVLLKDVEWMARALGPYEVGSKIGLHLSGGGWTLDVSQARRVDRATGLAVGERIAAGPTVSPRIFLNARGRVLAIKGERVAVRLDDADRDRIERARGRGVAERLTLPLGCVEKID